MLPPNKYDELLMQTLGRIEDKLDRQEDAFHKFVEKQEVQASTIRRDLVWHRRWITGSTSLLFTSISALASWLWFHISRGN